MGTSVVFRRGNRGDLLGVVEIGDRVVFGCTCNRFLFLSLFSGLTVVRRFGGLDSAGACKKKIYFYYINVNL